MLSVADGRVTDLMRLLEVVGSIPTLDISVFFLGSLGRFWVFCVGGWRTEGVAGISRGRFCFLQDRDGWHGWLKGVGLVALWRDDDGRASIQD